jgi:pimeloyl-ACP methyl ester carboxylesterase
LTQPIGAEHDSFHFLQAAGEDFCAVLTTPPTPSGIGVVVLSGGTGIPSSGRNRSWVRLARRLAAQGHHVVRLDYRGVGESGGETRLARLDEPNVEEVAAAAELLRGAGCTELVFMGTCFGARTALAGAASIDGVTGLALFPVPVRDFARGMRTATKSSSWYLRRGLTAHAWKGLADPARRKAQLRAIRKKLRLLTRRATGRTTREEAGSGGTSRLFLSQLETALGKQVSVLLLYGEHDDFYEDFERARRGRLGKVLAQAGTRVEIEVVEGKLHGLTTLAAQDIVVERSTAWLGRQRSTTLSKTA